jgi:hypothetical protein
VIFPSSKLPDAANIFASNFFLVQVSTSCIFAYLESTFRFVVVDAGLWFSALWAFNR